MTRCAPVEIIETLGGANRFRGVCACGYVTPKFDSHERTSKILEIHAENRTATTVSQVAQALFRVVHPNAAPYAGQTPSTIESFENLARYVHEHGFEL